LQNTDPALSNPATQNFEFGFVAECVDPRYSMGIEALRDGWKRPNSSAENSSGMIPTDRRQKRLKCS
jgi:hypothetical protein